MSAAEKLHLSYEEYVALEAQSPTKHEYFQGEVWAMAGGTAEHSLIQANLIGEIRSALKGRPCAVFTSELRVRIEATDRTTYPDLFVICGKRDMSSRDPNAATNPVVIVEVLSDSTELDDRGSKFAHYRQIPSLAEYVLVSQKEKRIEIFRKGPEGWVLSDVSEGQSLELRAIHVSIPVDAIYFDPTAP